MARMIKVKLVRSSIGHPEKHRRILRALGLTKLNKTRQFYPNPAILGAIRKVAHFVELEIVEE
ncbi:MAG: 50S ribosomal protein L30 [Thermodesulforhabdaceae bacterium]